MRRRFADAESLRNFRFWLLALLVSAGCSGQASVTEPDAAKSTKESVAEESGRHETVLRTTWDAYFVQGAKAGWFRSTISEIGTGANRTIRTRQLLRLKILRAGAPFEATLTANCAEKPNGEVVEFDASIPLGQERPLVLHGVVRGEELRWQRVEGGKSEELSLTMPPGTRGFMGVEQSLLAQPLEPGQRRTITQLHLPPHNIVETVELEAADYESIELLSGAFRLLKVRQSTSLAGNAPIVTTLWTNREGEVLKSFSEVGGIETYRTIQSVAEADGGAAKIDVALDVNVPLDRPLPRGLETARAVYDVTLKDGDPAAMFPKGSGQSVEPQDKHTVRLTLAAIRPKQMPESGDQKSEDAGQKSVDPKYLASSSLVQSDDPRVKKLADEASQDKSVVSWELAVALEKFVHKSITAKDYTQAFASAAEVAASRQGDCTEHAVLLAALCRTRGIPARVAMGLVYQTGGQNFAYHMWTEVFLVNQWIPLDATLGRGGIGATHLKLADSDLGGASAYSSFLPVLQVMGRLKIKLVDAE